MAQQPISVLIVDDSKIMRDMLEKILSSDPMINVVGKAADPYIARDLIKLLNPQVITLDIIMPKMDGITFLRNLMRLHPMPVVMISTLAERGSAVAIEALALGAIDYVPKPTSKDFENMEVYSRNLIQTIKDAAGAKMNYFFTHENEKETIENALYQASFLRENLIAIGGSTGGVEAIESILICLPKTLPGIVITQHIRQEFAAAFAKRMDKLCRLTVKEAEDNEEILPGTVYIATSPLHLTVIKTHKRFYCKLVDSPPVNGHRPSVDVLFESVAEVAGSHSIGILLTGMGEDGARGAKKISEAGGIVIAQDEETSIVWGMPGTAVKLQAVDYLLPLNQIPYKIFNLLDELANKDR